MNASPSQPSIGDMHRRLLALLVAVLLGDAAYLTLQHPYIQHSFEIQLGDDQGHGPDYDTPEGQASVDRAIHFRSVLGGVAAGLFGFAAAFTLSCRSRVAPVA